MEFPKNPLSQGGGFFIWLQRGCREDDVGGNSRYTGATVVPGGVELIGVVFWGAAVNPLDQVNPGEGIAVG